MVFDDGFGDRQSQSGARDGGGVRVSGTEAEPRVGGTWQLVMVYEEDGVSKESPTDAVISVYDPPSLLVASQKAKPHALTTLQVEMRLEFEDLGGRTRLHLTQGRSTAPNGWR
jgi:uncharacterized protein YndB with AHSA1/START domain